MEHIGVRNDGALRDDQRSQIHDGDFRVMRFAKARRLRTGVADQGTPRWVLFNLATTLKGVVADAADAGRIAISQGATPAFRRRTTLYVFVSTTTMEFRAVSAIRMWSPEDVTATP